MADLKRTACLLTIMNELSATKRVHYEQFMDSPSTIAYVGACVAADLDQLPDVMTTNRSRTGIREQSTAQRSVNTVGSVSSGRLTTMTVAMAAGAKDEEITERCKARRREPEPICQIDDITFREHFGMDKPLLEELFRQILTKVQEVVDEGRGRAFFCPSPKKILLTAWLLCTQESFHSVADRFRVSKGGMHVIFINTCKLLLRRVEDFIRWPSHDEQRATAENLEARYGFPGVTGAVGELVISQSVKSGSKVSPSVVVVQGVCDASQCFVDVHVGYPGQCPVTRTIVQTPLFLKLSDRMSLSDDHHLLGDVSYPLMSTLMIPFHEDGMLTTAQTKYNVAHSAVCSMISRTFARLIGRFRRLNSLHMAREDLVPIVTHAVCCLHNFIVRHEDVESNDYGVIEQTESVEPYCNILCPEMDAFEKRDRIVQHLNTAVEFQPLSDDFTNL